MQPIKMQPKKWIVYALLAASSLSLAACATPIQAITGSTVTQEMEFEDFEQFEVSDAFQVQIRQGDEYQVIVEVDERSLSHLEVNQNGDTLEIRIRPHTNLFFLNFNSVRRAEITMPTLVGVTARDASHVDVSGFSTEEDAHFEVADASSLEGEIDTGDTRFIAADASNIQLEGDRRDVEIEASDASNVRLVGEGRNATIRAADASHVDLSDFPIEDANIETRDASSVTVDVAGTLDADARDGSDIVYYGDPSLGDIDSSDGSSIEARD